MKKISAVSFIAHVAVLAALYFALSLVSLSLGSMKLSVAGLVSILAGVLMGGAGGFFTGFVGALLEQLVKYGLGPTTLLWVLPPAVRGLMVGLMCARLGGDPSRRQLLVINVLSALVLTALNTLAMYLDSVFYGYYTRVYVFGALLARIAAGILTAVIFSVILPPLVKQIRRHARL